MLAKLNTGISRPGLEFLKENTLSVSGRTPSRSGRKSRSSMKDTGDVSSVNHSNNDDL